MKVPGADHPITIEPANRRIRIRAGGVTVADTVAGLVLREAGYPAVCYIPRADADMALLVRTERRTYCPYKGDASYYSIRTPAGEIDNAVWSYEAPFPAMAAIAGYLAFYPDNVTFADAGSV